MALLTSHIHARGCSHRLPLIAGPSGDAGATAGRSKGMLCRSRDDPHVRTCPVVVLNLRGVLLGCVGMDVVPSKLDPKR